MKTEATVLFSRNFSSRSITTRDEISFDCLTEGALSAEPLMPSLCLVAPFQAFCESSSACSELVFTSVPGPNGPRYPAIGFAIWTSESNEFLLEHSPTTSEANVML